MQPGDPPKEPSVFQQVMAWANKLWGTPQEKNERQKITPPGSDARGYGTAPSSGGKQRNSDEENIFYSIDKFVYKHCLCG